MRQGDLTGCDCTHQDLAGTVLARCRPGASGWFLAIFFALIGGVIVATAPGATTDVASQRFFGCFGAALLVPAVIFAAWLLRAQVVADDSGLRWRGLGRWRCASWAQVSDYYEKPFPRANHLYIETSAGTINLSEELWSGAQRLRSAVEQHATSALAKTWATLGTRPDERWPLEFGYAPADECTAAVVLGFGGLAAVGLMVDMFTPAHLRGVMDIARYLGWPLGLLGVAVWLAFGLILPAMVLPLGLIFQEMRRRRGHCIVAKAEGLVFECGSHRVAAKWDEVTDYFMAPLPGRLSFGVRCVVITARGTFDFTPLLRDSIVLQRVIARHARNARASGWRTRTETEEVLGSEASRRGRDSRGYHERIYHYRTRTNRALLWFPPALALMYALVPALMSQASLQPPRGSAGPFLAGIMGFLMLWGWWRYRSASVRTSAWGITQHTLFGRRFIPWDKVRDFHEAGGDVWTFGIVAGDRTRIWFWLGIGDADELKDEIARRAVNARASQWQRKAPARRTSGPPH